MRLASSNTLPNGAADFSELALLVAVVEPVFLGTFKQILAGVERTAKRGASVVAILLTTLEEPPAELVKTIG